jgi:phospholipase C
MAENAMERIKHLVVVMMENRSFDNLLGFLYSKENNVPPINIPAPPAGGQNTFDGLIDPNPTSPFWNPSNKDYFSGKDPIKVYATRGTTGTEPFLVPNPDPHEEFDRITYQILGPAGWSGPKMMGFVVDYGTPPKEAQNPSQLMQSYSPEQVSVISELARNYAVSDRWFCSTPNQTLPNRAFMHAGTSMGRVNNTPEPLYDAETIFEVLEDTRRSWNVYNDTMLMSLARLQFPQLWEPDLQPHFHDMEKFERDAAAGELPEYSFVEPSFQIQPNDEHPPHDVTLGEQFLLRVWKAVSTGQGWNKTLLIITFDEHGGCYDHVVPPSAIPPDKASDPGNAGFHFDRYGVRIPTILISPYIEAGTVFRSPTFGTPAEVPYDHTSILATVQEWLQIPKEKRLASERVRNAPTFANVLTRATARTDVPPIAVSIGAPAKPTPPLFATNDLQYAMVRAQGSRYLHNLANLPKLRTLRKPPPKSALRQQNKR